MGLFAKQAFPKSLVTSLIQYTFNGFWNQVKTPSQLVTKSSSQLWKNVRYSINILPPSSSVESTNDKSEAEKLNKLDSQYWLLIHLAESFQEAVNIDDIFWRVRELEEQRNTIVARLKPLKRIYFKGLYSFENIIDSLPSFSNKSKKYDQIEKVLNELVQSYVHSENASELQIQELIEILRDRVSKLPKSQSLYNVWRLMDWMHTQIRSSNIYEIKTSAMDAEYPPVRALKDKPTYKAKYHVPNGCIVGYPKVEKPEDKERIDFYGSIEEAERFGRDMCDNCKKKLNKKSFYL